MKKINVQGESGIIILDRSEDTSCYYLDYEQNIQQRSQKLVGVPILSLHLNTNKHQRDIDFMFDKQIYMIEEKIKKDMLIDKEKNQMYKFIQKDYYYEEGEQLHRQINVGYFVTSKTDNFKIRQVVSQPNEKEE